MPEIALYTQRELTSTMLLGLIRYKGNTLDDPKYKKEDPDG